MDCLGHELQVSQEELNDEEVFEYLASNAKHTNGTSRTGILYHQVLKGPRCSQSAISRDLNVEESRYVRQERNKFDNKAENKSIPYDKNTSNATVVDDLSHAVKTEEWYQEEADEKECGLIRAYTFPSSTDYAHYPIKPNDKTMHNLKGTTNQICELVPSPYTQTETTIDNQLKNDVRQIANLKNHIQVLHKKNKGLQCEHCNYNASRAKDVKNHAKTMHRNIKAFLCGRCNYSTALDKNLKSHIISVHEKCKGFQCEHCDYRVSGSLVLKNHIKSVHDKLKDVQCGQCAYSASENRHLTSHINAVHNKIKGFQCEQCLYSASASADIKRHIKSVHNKIRDFQCDRCDYSSSQNNHLKRHINTIHNKTR